MVASWTFLEGQLMQAALSSFFILSSTCTCDTHVFIGAQFLPWAYRVGQVSKGNSELWAYRVGHMYTDSSEQGRSGVMDNSDLERC